MDFSFTPEQITLRDAVRQFAAKEIGPCVAAYDREERLPLDIYKKIAELGFTGGTVPEQYGGAGLDHISFTLIIEEIARYCQSLASHVASSSCGPGAALLRYGTEEQKQRYLVPLAKGEAFAAMAITEPQSGTDVASLQATYKKTDDGFLIHGNKIWISNLDHASFILTLATFDRSLKHKGISAFLLEPNFPGVSHIVFKNKVGFRLHDMGELVLDQVRVPKEYLLGEEGQGFRVAMAAVETGRLQVAARACGMIRACLEESVKYAKERVVFDQPIGRYQLIQSKIADMVVGLETARAMTYRLAWLKDQPGKPRARMEASVAKMYATDVLMRVATEAMQIFGAYSCSDEYPIGRYFRDAKFFQIIEGTNEIHRTLIADYALGYRQG